MVSVISLQLLTNELVHVQYRENNEQISVQCAVCGVRCALYGPYMVVTEYSISSISKHQPLSKAILTSHSQYAVPSYVRAKLLWCFLFFNYHVIFLQLC